MREPDPIERPDEAALEELRRAFEEPGEQFSSEVDEAALDLKQDPSTIGSERAGRSRTKRRWRFGRRRRSSASSGGAGGGQGVDPVVGGPVAMESSGTGWPTGPESDLSMVRVLDPDEQIPTTGVQPDGRDAVGDGSFGDGSFGDGPADATGSMATASTDAGAHIISIEDAGIPDTVYLDGRLEPMAHSGAGFSDGVGSIGAADPDAPLGERVVIDDDFGPDPVDVVGEPRTSVTMEPRIRDRRVEVRRAIGRRRLRMIIAVAIVVVAGVAALAVLGSSVFGVRADQVDVIGAVYTDSEALSEIIDDLVGRPTLTLDTERAEQQLRSIAWVESAQVRASFPHRLTIDIRERAPLATFRGPDGLFRVIDRDGRVLDVITGEPVAYLLLEIPDVDNLSQGQFTTQGPAAAADLVQALTPGIRQRVQMMEVALDGSDLVVVLAPWEGSTDRSPIRVQFGAASDLLVKLVRLESVLEIAEQRNATNIDISTVEVSIR